MKHQIAVCVVRKQMVPVPLGIKQEFLMRRQKHSSKTQSKGTRGTAPWLHTPGGVGWVCVCSWLCVLALEWNSIAIFF